MSTDSYISYKELVGQLDIQSGDVVLVSSSLKKLLCTCRANGEVFDADKFIDTILSAVGDQGTVLFPTYNWDWCKGKGFDPVNTPSRCGALSTVALGRDDIHRTQHPIYSFAVWGRDAGHLLYLNNLSAFGHDSVFEYLYKIHAKNLFIGIDYKLAMTPVHYAEQTVGVPWRYPKTWMGEYGIRGVATMFKAYSMYVRNPELCLETIIDPRMDGVLTDYQQTELNGIYFGLIGLRNIIDLMINDLQFQKYLLVYPKKPETA